jgi:hypothetical protein
MVCLVTDVLDLFDPRPHESGYDAFGLQMVQRLFEGRRTILLIFFG